MIIEVPINKSKAIKRFVLFILLLLLFALMSTQPHFFVKSGELGFVKAVGYIGTFVSIVLVAFVAQKVFNKKPGLIIDNEGVVDNSLGVMFSKVRWADVTEMKHLESNGQHFIALVIKNSQQYIAAEPNPIKRKMLELNYSTIKTPVNIAAGRLKMDFEELYARMDSEWEKNNCF